MSNITSKSTKEQIFQALQEAQAKLHHLTTTYDPQAEARKSKDVATVKVAQSVSGTIEDSIITLKREVTNTLDGLTKGITEKTKIFHDIEQAIIIQREKLQELYQIEDEAQTLVALVNAKQALSAEYDQQMAEKKSQVESALVTLQARISEEQALHNKTIAEQKKATEQERKREREEYEYNFNREKNKKLHELEDQMNQQKKDFNVKLEEVRAKVNAEAKAVDAREEAVSKREERMEDLENLVDSIPAEIERVKKETEEEVTHRLTNHHNRELEFRAKEHKHHADSHENQVKHLQQALQAEQLKNIELTKKLDSAYQEIREIATKTLDSTGDRKVNVALESLIRDLGKKTN